MPRILLSELLGQLQIVERRLDEARANVRFETEPDKKAKAKDVAKRLRDRKRVIEDRIMEYEPDPVPRAMDRKADSQAQSGATTGHGSTGRTPPFGGVTQRAD